MNRTSDAATMVSCVEPMVQLNPRGSAAHKPGLNPQVKLSRAHVAISQRPGLADVARRRLAAMASSLGEQLKASVRIEPMLTAMPGNPVAQLAQRALFVTFDLGGAVALLELDLLTVSALLSQVSGDQEPAGLPTRLSTIDEAALGWVCLSALAEWRRDEALGALAPRLVSLSLDRGATVQQLSSTGDFVTYALNLEIGATRCGARFMVPALWLQARAEAHDVETLPLVTEVAQAMLPARCLLGRLQLGPAERRALGPGDVVVFSGVSNHASGLTGSGRLIFSTFELVGTFAEEGFTLTRVLPRPPLESPMSVDDAAASVEVEIELTRLRLPLHQLGTVRPGSVIPLHINAAHQVVVRLGETAIARAELVDIEGEIGARIIAMLGK